MSAHLLEDIVAVQVRQEEADADGGARPEDWQDPKQPQLTDFEVKKVLNKNCNTIIKIKPSSILLQAYKLAFILSSN